MTRLVVTETKDTTRTLHFPSTPLSGNENKMGKENHNISNMYGFECGEQSGRGVGRHGR